MTSMSVAGPTGICSPIEPPIEPRRRRVDTLTALPGHGLNPEFGHDKTVAISIFDFDDLVGAGRTINAKVIDINLSLRVRTVTVDDLLSLCDKRGSRPVDLSIRSIGLGPGGFSELAITIRTCISASSGLSV